MKHEIIGDNLQMAKIDLAAGEGVLAEAGAMVNMSGQMQMQSRMVGGMVSGIKRVPAEESLFFFTLFHG